MASFLFPLSCRIQLHGYIFTLANATWYSKALTSSYPKARCPPITGTFNTISTSAPYQGRILGQIFRTIRAAWFRKKPRLVGTDSQGNRFFEAPPNKASEHSTKSSRSQRFVLMPGQKTIDDPWMSVSGNFPNLAPEWYAWLRHKRVDPPDDAEIKANAAAIVHRQALARQLEAKYEAEREQMIREGLLRKPSNPSSSVNPGVNTDSVPTGSAKPKVAFPVRSTFETVPGEGIASGKKFPSDDSQ